MTVRILFGAVCGLVLAIITWVMWPHRYESSGVVSFHFDSVDKRRFADPPSRAEAERSIRSFAENRNERFSDRNLREAARRSGLEPSELRRNTKIKAIPTLPFYLNLAREQVISSSSFRVLCCWEVSYQGSDPIVSKDVALELLITYFSFPEVPPLLLRDRTCPEHADCIFSGFQPDDLPHKGRDTRPPMWHFGLAGTLLGAIAATVLSRPQLAKSS